MKKRRILILSLSFTLLIGLFACGKEEPGDNQPPRDPPDWPKAQIVLPAVVTPFIIT